MLYVHDDPNFSCRMIIKEDDTVDDAASGRASTAKSALNIVSGGKC